MGAATLWVAFISACAAIASAAFAFVQAKAATDSRRDADEARDEARFARDESARLAAEANDAFKRQADAQEEANRIEREKMAPDDWAHMFVAGDTFRVLNTSGGRLVVSEVISKPDGVGGILRFSRRGEPGIYEYGDSIEYLHHRVMGPNPEQLLINYRRDDDEQDRTYIVVL